MPSPQADRPARLRRSRRLLGLIGSRRGRGVVSVASAILAGIALGIGLRVGIFSCTVLLLQQFTWLAGLVAGALPWADPVYTHAALRSLGDVHVQGLAVGGPLGALLHELYPVLFVEPARARLTLMRLAVQPGSALIGRLIAAGVAHAGMLTVGLLLVRAGYLHRRTTRILTGIVLQAQVALSVLGAQPSVRELESTGMSFAANALLPWLWQRGQALTDGLADVPPPLVAGTLVSLALVVGYVPAGLVIAWRARGRVVTFASAFGVVMTSAACAGVLQPVPPGPLLTAASLEPTRALTSLPEPSLPPLVAAPARLALVSDRWFSDTPTASPPRPTRVEVQGSNYHYQFLVDGHPLVLKGMGLNTQYTQTMTADERAARLDADMTAFQQLGINTVLGWDPAEFDQVLLDAAARHDIGVVMPFDLDPEADYTDATVRQHLHDQVMDWVARYRAEPALRMWGLGNEVLHKIVHPAWVGPQDPQREHNAEAFSTWLIETADAIHAADPDHPVTYREAEDAFVPWVVTAAQQVGGGPRPWFVWGTNCYQDYLSKIVDTWPDAGLDVPLWVSEFAPGTSAVPDRPDGFKAMWGDTRRHPEWVLGGAVYAWTRNGPEGVDRNFGLTDDGVPVDGRSLDMLEALFQSD